MKTSSKRPKNTHILYLFCCFSNKSPAVCLTAPLTNLVRFHRQLHLGVKLCRQRQYCQYPVTVCIGQRNKKLEGRISIFTQLTRQSLRIPDLSSRGPYTSRRGLSACWFLPHRGVPGNGLVARRSWPSEEKLWSSPVARYITVIQQSAPKLRRYGAVTVWGLAPDRALCWGLSPWHAWLYGDLFWSSHQLLGSL